MSLVGAGYGASVALEGILEQALKEKALEQRREIELAQIEQRKQEADGMREHRQRLIDLDQIRLKADEKQAEIEQNQQGEKQRAFDNVAGLGDMGLDPQTARRESVVSLGRAGVANAPQYAREAFPDPEKPERDPMKDYEGRKQIDLKYARPISEKPQVFNVGGGKLVDGTGKVIYDGGGQAAEGGPSPYTKERTVRTLQSVDELIGKVNKWTTGYGSVLANIPQTEARDFAAELNTLKANVAFNELTQMREASKTGGALGAIAVQELELLQSALGALDQGQSPENLKAQLTKMKTSIDRWEKASGGSGRGEAGSGKPLSVDELIKKYGGQ